MATVKQRKEDTGAPLADGEFWRISGIADATDKSLHAAGIDTFEQLAALSPDEIAAMLSGQVGVKERAARQDWTGQARKLAEILSQHITGEPFAQDFPGESSPGETIESEFAGERQHYESYLVELLVGDECAVRRTRVAHVQGGEKETWAGWDPDRLAGWIQERAGMQAQPQELPVEPTAALLADSAPPADRLVGQLRFGSAKAVREPGTPSRFFSAGEPFIVRIALDLSDVETALPESLSYQATMVAHRMDARERLTAGQAEGMIEPSSQAELSIPSTGLPEGTYRLETMVLVFNPAAAYPEREGLRAFTEGTLIQVTRDT